MKFITKKEMRNGIEHTFIECIPETEEEKKEAEEDRKFWKENGCHCKENHGTYYLPDGADKVCWKHHYRCNKCHGITQIG